MTEDELFEGACRAYTRACKREGAIVDCPSRYDSAVYGESSSGIYTVVLRNVRGVMAAYRVGKNGRFREVKFEQR